MKLTSNKALEMLEETRVNLLDDRWIDHSICVGQTASKIADKLNLDSEYAKTLGYIHDIGKSTGDFDNHIVIGYKLLKELGYDDKYCNVCLTHSYLNNDINCTAGIDLNDIPFREDFINNYKYNIYDKIINLCDLICTTEVTTLELRLEDIISRRGINKNTEYHRMEAYKLKKYFDDLLGFDLYDLFN